MLCLGVDQSAWRITILVWESCGESAFGTDHGGYTGTSGCRGV